MLRSGLNLGPCWLERGQGRRGHVGMRTRLEVHVENAIAAVVMLVGQLPQRHVDDLVGAGRIHARKTRVKQGLGTQLCPWRT